MKNGSLEVRDFATRQVPTPRPTGSAGPVGPAGTPALRPTTVTINGPCTAMAGRSRASLVTSQTIPAYSQVTGLSFESSSSLRGCDRAYVYAGIGSTADNNGFAYIRRSADGSLSSYFYGAATGATPAPIFSYLYCDGDVSSTNLEAAVSNPTFDPTSSVTYDATQAAPTSTPSTLMSAPQSTLAPSNR